MAEPWQTLDLERVRPEQVGEVIRAHSAYASLSAGRSLGVHAVAIASGLLFAGLEWPRALSPDAARTSRELWAILAAITLAVAAAEWLTGRRLARLMSGLAARSERA